MELWDTLHGPADLEKQICQMGLEEWLWPLTLSDVSSLTTGDTPPQHTHTLTYVLLPSLLSLQCLNESLGPKVPNSKMFFPAPQLSNYKNTKYSQFFVYPETRGDLSPQNLLPCSPCLSVALLTHLIVEAKSLTGTAELSDRHSPVRVSILDYHPTAVPSMATWGARLQRGDSPPQPEY